MLKSQLCDHRCGRDFFESDSQHKPEGYVPQSYYMLEALTEHHLRCLDCVAQTILQPLTPELETS